MTFVRPTRPLLVCAGILFSVGPAVSARMEQAREPWRVARTANGQPDLQGVWDFQTMTPLERPPALRDKEVLSEEDVAEIEARADRRNRRLARPLDPDRGSLPVGGSIGSYNNFWMDDTARVSPDRRTSLIVDPPDGRIPPRVAGAKVQVAGEDLPTDVPVRVRARGVGNESYQNRGLSERCLQGFNTGPPITPRAYNQNIQIFQTGDYFLILNEMIHDVRIVPLDDRPRLPEPMRPWLGQSRGRWEGDTLVVETQSFTEKISSFSANAALAYGDASAMRLTERFERIDEETLRYEFTVDDPETFVRPFTGVLLMRKSTSRIYEYACHEGNYGLRHILQGARSAETREASRTD